MCGRYVLGDSSWFEYFKALSIIRPNEQMGGARFHVCPTQSMPIILGRDKGYFEINAQWGLRPRWNDRQLLINAKIETARSKPTFSKAWSLHRCLVPASGWYEWTGAKGAKQPWYIATDQPVISFAGLYFETSDLGASYVILTRAADPAVADIHHRMPVMLRDDQYRSWLDHDAANDDAVIETMGTDFGAALTSHKIAPLKMGAEGPHLIEAQEKPAEPAIRRLI